MIWLRAAHLFFPRQSSDAVLSITRSDLWKLYKCWCNWCNTSHKTAKIAKICRLNSPQKPLPLMRMDDATKLQKLQKKKCKKCRLKLPSNPYRWRGWMMQVHSLNFCPCEASVVVRRRFWRVTRFTVGSLGMAAANQRFTFSRSRSSCCNPSQTPDMAGRAPSQDQLLRRCEISGLQSLDFSSMKSGFPWPCWTLGRWSPWGPWAPLGPLSSGSCTEELAQPAAQPILAA